jgi:hypothetical protein
MNKLNIYSLAILMVLTMFSPQWVLAQEIEVPTQTAKYADHYPWITFLSEGPIDWFEKDETAKVQGRAFRVVVLTSEIYNTIYLEEITLGREGCCKRLAQIRKFNLEVFAKGFGFIGELSGFEVIRWVTPTSFEFRFRERSFLMSEINRSRVKVKRLSGS